MRRVKSRLTVFFEAPFWVGLYEREDGGRYEVCRIVFGAEPKDYEVYAFIEAGWRKMRFSPPVAVDMGEEHKVNPKRMQRDIRRSMERSVMGTKSQQALAAQREEGKLQRRISSKEEKEQERQARYGLRQKKRREKHRGR